MFNLEKFKLEGKVSLSLIKHRGNVSLVSSETKVPIEYVEKIYGKIKGKMKRDAGYWMSVFIMEKYLLGYEQRTTHLTEILNKFRCTEQANVSICCDAPLDVRRIENEDIPFCLKCGKRAYPHDIMKDRIFELSKEYIEQLREEDKLLLEFAAKMGFTQQEGAPTNVFRNNIVVLDGKKKSSEDDKVMKRLGTLSPKESQRLRNALEKELLGENNE